MDRGWCKAREGYCLEFLGVSIIMFRLLDESILLHRWLGVFIMRDAINARISRGLYLRDLSKGNVCHLGAGGIRT